jgi:hypothetical protein
MCTVCTEWAQTTTQEMLRTADGAKLLISIRERMNGGFYGANYINLFVNNWRSGPYSLEDALIFSRCFTMLWSGKLLMCVLTPSCHEGPGPDRDVDGNNRRLGTVPRPFAGKFHGGINSGSDGSIRWNEKVLMERKIDDLTGKIRREMFWVEPGFVDLEVGTLSNYNGYHRIILDGGIARWPYDSEDLTIILPISRRGRMLTDWSEAPSNLVPIGQPL